MGDSYAKSWVDKFNDEWYLSLKLNERGMFDQLFTYAKLNGDSGRIFLRNYPVAGHLFGCDGKICRRILRKFHIDGKIILNESGITLEIEIVNYLKRQRATPKRRDRYKGKLTEKSRENGPQAEQSIAEQSIAVTVTSSKEEPPPEKPPPDSSVPDWQVLKIREMISFSAFAPACRPPKDKDWIAYLIAHFAYNRLLEILKQLLDAYRIRGYPAPAETLKCRQALYDKLENHRDGATDKYDSDKFWQDREAEMKAEKKAEQ